ncbi:nucleoside hydrolase-like domain-containing protein [Sphingomonas sp. ASY06-1R]|uniref:DUF1593 domain-containing protein n=1 Tax=Sphingomonas sp. ASY06-1R TaxID=3445771 RepID=UPI003FA1B193
MIVALAGMIALASPIAAQAPLPAPAERQRMIVLSDIEADPDDTQSFVRLLLYANEIDIEGLVATTSIHMKTSLHPESIRRIIQAYARVQPNLLKHETGYPAPDRLLALVREGQPGYGMAIVGAGKDTAGSRLIIEALERRDPRPLWVTVWGGANTLAQALYTIRATRTPEEARRLIAKLRVATISDQDDSGAWIRRTFPDLFYVVSPGGYGAGTWTGIHTLIDGGDNITISNAWLRDNIQQGHGPLGAIYPDVAYGMEGDTPAYLSLIPNGLSVPEHPDWGGWGGRYELYTPPVATTDPSGFSGVPIEPETRPIWTNAIDMYKPQMAKPYGRAHEPGDRQIKDFRAGIWRWRDDFQNDFAARMTWTTQPFDHANHPPVVKLATSRLTVKSGQRFVLSAIDSRDPDGDSLSFQWFHYQEIGHWQSPIANGISANIHTVDFTAPVVTEPREAHFIVRVTDKGEPPLTRYGRVIVTITP